MNIVLTAETRKAIADGVSKTLLGQRAMSKAADALQAQEVTSDMMYAPKDKNADRSFYDSLCASVVMGFAKSVQELLQKPAKSLRKTYEPSPSKMEQTTGDKRYWEQQIGSKVKDLRKMIERREKKAEREANGEDGEDGEETTSTLESRIIRDLSAYITKLEKVEAFSGDLIGLQNDLKSAISRIIQ